MLAILSPGQGAQKHGFLESWLELDGVEKLLASFCEAAGVDLIAAGTVLSDSDITDTAVAQPLIVAAGLATATQLGALPTPTVFAGHSVGEFTAAALSGALEPGTALRLIAVRGRAMAAASAAAPSGMAAVLGGDEAVVLEAIAAAGCAPANHNGAGQIVAAGPAGAVQLLVDNPPAGARVRRLAVAGAFHTELMSPAKSELAAAADSVMATAAQIGILSNRDGTLVADGREILDRLVAQVCLPVRWDACMRTLATLGVTATIELAPAGTLTGLIKRSLPDVTAVALRSPDDLPAARAAIEEHGNRIPSHQLDWKVLVAPAVGTVRLPRAGTGAGADRALAAGDVVARVATRTEELAVTATSAGQLIELLVHDGDPVSLGQPLARVSAQT